MILSIEEHITLKEKLVEFNRESYKINNVGANLTAVLTDRENEIYSSFKQETNKSSVSEFLEYLSDFKEITLTIAFKPTQQVKLNVLDFLQNVVSKNVVLSFVHNANILAGAIVEYSGIHKDYSLSKQLNDL